MCAPHVQTETERKETEFQLIATFLYFSDLHWYFHKIRSNKLNIGRWLCTCGETHHHTLVEYHKRSLSGHTDLWVYSGNAHGKKTADQLENTENASKWTKSIDSERIRDLLWRTSSHSFRKTQVTFALHSHSVASSNILTVNLSTSTWFWLLHFPNFLIYLQDKMGLAASKECCRNFNKMINQGFKQIGYLIWLFSQHILFFNIYLQKWHVYVFGRRFYPKRLTLILQVAWGGLSCGGWGSGFELQSPTWKAAIVHFVMENGGQRQAPLHPDTYKQKHIS